MSYDLKPRHTDAGWFRCGAFSWSWLLDEGVGWPLGYCEGMEPGRYYCEHRPERLGTPMTNDGYHVTAGEAREMAKLARYVAAKHRTWQYHWQHLPETERKRRLDAREQPMTRGTYRYPIREDFIDLAEKFADWAEKSGGFRIL
jgi:hypothetical protein